MDDRNYLLFSPCTSFSRGWETQTTYAVKLNFFSTPQIALPPSRERNLTREIGMFCSKFQIIAVVD